MRTIFYDEIKMDKLLFLTMESKGAYHLFNQLHYT